MRGCPKDTNMEAKTVIVIDVREVLKLRNFRERLKKEDIKSESKETMDHGNEVVRKFRGTLEVK